MLTHNPNSANPFRLDRSEAITCDMNHDYTAEQKAYNGGLLDKFVEFASSTDQECTDPSSKKEVMGYYDGKTVTALWNYAQHYAMSDNSFNTVFGPSTPGHLNLVSGQTYGASPSNISDFLFMPMQKRTYHSKLLYSQPSFMRSILRSQHVDVSYMITIKSQTDQVLERSICMDLNLSNKEARDVKDQDLGKILEVDHNYVLIEKGTSNNNERFYIPLYLLEKYDEDTLWFRIDQEEVKNNFTVYSQPLSDFVKA